MDFTTLKEGFIGQKMISLPKSLIKRSKKNKIIKQFYTTDLGYYPKANHHYIRRNKGTSEYIFIYCTKGKGEIYSDGTKNLISPNQFFIIPKNVKHEYRADESDPWSIYWFHFKGDIAEKLYNRYKLTNTENYKNVPFSIEKINQFEKIFNLFSLNNLENHIEYSNLLSLSFISSFIYYDFKSDINLVNKESIIDDIKNYLLQNLGKSLNLNEIADKFNYSKSYLHTKFKKNTGYSIMVFFNLKKTQKACEYLNYTDLSIKEISFKVGFEDPLYFSRIFKNFMGESPRYYRKKYRK
ncbi:AraC family transcriptional regulator [Polaribacter porphyrae]|uniref:HTH araC/xylS-type domain-containing protein n=1 Tax=Polaribacter porphyrae TaxID=1137780 RepID=A0A2S7WPQ7_9FLAO|nr:AraC family transcriptional regulator [Polaribacter porphyrae]PQJ79598.1 hypothetical protein BTO18_10625 [Polaribacter porphyrae]